MPETESSAVTAAAADAGREDARFDESCLYRAGKGMVQGAVGGLWIGLGMLAWYPDPYRFDHKGTVVKKALDAAYIFRNVKGPIMWSTAVCGVFSITECLVEQMRDEAHHKTYHNAAAGGAAAGLVMGSMTKRIDVMAASALTIGLTMGMVEYNGKSYVADPATAARKWTPFARAEEEEETKTLKGLKEKYPEFKNL